MKICVSLIFGDKLSAPGVEFGLEGGYNFSTLTGMESGSQLSTLNLGFYFDIRLKNQWYLNTGILAKSKMGLGQLSQDDLEFLQTEVYAEAGDYDQIIKYFLVPVLGKYKFKNHLYLEAGPQFGLMHNAYVEFESDVEGKDIRVREYNKDKIQIFDGGIIAGMGYTLLKGTGVTIGVKYYYGFGNVYKEKTGTRNRSLFLKLNIPIGGSQ